MYGHPGMPRNPFLKPQPNNVQYSAWTKHFAWKPVVTLSGERVWLTTVYKRKRTVQEPVSMKVGQLNQMQYIQEHELVTRRLAGED